MTENRTPTPVYLDPGMHPGLEVKGLKFCDLFEADIESEKESAKRQLGLRIYCWWMCILGL